MSEKNILNALAIFLCIQHSGYADSCEQSLKVTAKFRAMGPIQEVAGLAWSAVAPVAMKHPVASAYCSQLGGGARLPSREEYLDWMGANGVPGVDLDEAKSAGPGEEVSWGGLRPWYWTSTLHAEHSFRAFYFDGDTGTLTETFRVFPRAFRCVVECD